MAPEQEKVMIEESQQMRLKWNTHQSSIFSTFINMLQSETLVDVTILAEGRQLRAHKIVLSACSTYFHDLFIANITPHPIVIVKDVMYCDLKKLVEFMYYGEVNVMVEDFPRLIEAAKVLNIKGLVENETETLPQKRRRLTRATVRFQDDSATSISLRCRLEDSDSIPVIRDCLNPTLTPATVSVLNSPQSSTVLTSCSKSQVIKLVPQRQVREEERNGRQILKRQSSEPIARRSPPILKKGASHPPLSKQPSNNQRVLTTMQRDSISIDKMNVNVIRARHCPAMRIGPPLSCNYCWNTFDESGRILRRKTKFHCPECKYNLCIVPCFHQYHSSQRDETT